MIDHENRGVGISETRALPVPLEPVGYQQRTPRRSGHVPIRCGTERGAQRHRELGTPICRDCLDAIKAKPLKAAPPPVRRANGINHGTYGGYQKCRKQPGGTCEDCKRAASTYRKALRDGVRATKPRREPTPPAPRQPTFDVAAARDDYAAGMGLRELAAKYGVARETVRRHLTREGTQIRHKTKGQPVDLARAVELYESGMPISQVAAQVGGTYSGVRKAIARAGVERRDDRARGLHAKGAA